MIIKKIIDLCKAWNTMHIREDGNGVQWFSDGEAMYPLHGIPRFEDEDEICRTFDISGKKKEKMQFAWSYTMPSEYSFADRAKEEICEPAPITLRDGTIPYFVGDKIMFMKKKYLAPLLDVPEDMISVYVRKGLSGAPYFAVKCGLMLNAVIAPCNAPDAVTVKGIEDMAERCRKELHGAGDTLEGEQGELDI